MLRMLNLDETKLICLEDPVEAEIKGGYQIGINERIGFTFAKRSSVCITARSRYDYDW